VLGIQRVMPPTLTKEDLEAIIFDISAIQIERIKDKTINIVKKSFLY
jgi:hypothetical protein